MTRGKHIRTNVALALCATLLVLGADTAAAVGTDTTTHYDWQNPTGENDADCKTSCREMYQGCTHDNTTAWTQCNATAEDSCKKPGVDKSECDQAHGTCDQYNKNINWCGGGYQVCVNACAERAENAIDSRPPQVPDSYIRALTSPTPEKKKEHRGQQ